MLLDTRLDARIAHRAMGTVMAHKAFGLNAEDALAAVIREIERLEGLLSCFLPYSDISCINNSAGIRSETVSDETFEVLAKAVAYSQSFPGCFDITIGPLVALWRRARESSAKPADLRIRQTLPLVNYRDLILDPWEMTVGLNHIGQSIDLGGIGKGFAGDVILEVLKDHGISSAYSNLGGNVVTLGAKPDGSPWQIGIQHPRHDNKIIGAVSVINQTVVTSGDYQRYFTDSRGRRYHHILNPSTGCPARSGLISVTIVAEKSLAADALSTMVFIAGLDKGLDILSWYPRTEAILVDDEMRIYITAGLKSRFQADQGINVTIVD